MLKDKVDKAPFILPGSLGMFPGLSLEGGCGQHLLGELGCTLGHAALQVGSDGCQRRVQASLCLEKQV